MWGQTLEIQSRPAKKVRQAAIAVILALGSLGSALAQISVERQAHLEAMAGEVQSTAPAQQATIRPQAGTIAEQELLVEGTPQRLKKLEESIEATQAEGGERNWYRVLNVAGLVEVEASHSAPYEGEDESGVSLATFELGVVAPMADWVEAGVTLLYEEDETPLEVDVAYVTLGNAEEHPLFMTTGQLYVPFGAYETRMVSEPLTLEIGETRELAWQLGFRANDLDGSLYAFDGDNDKDGEDRIASWGANLRFAQKSGDASWAAGIGYISDLGDSDTLQDVIAGNLGSNNTDFVAAWTVNAKAKFGRISLIGETVAATEAFDAAAVPWQAGGAALSAWSLELGYDLELFRKATTFAFGLQGTRESLALELPRERFLVALSMEIYDRTSLSLEWACDEDYEVSDGGAGESANSVIARIAFEF